MSAKAHHAANALYSRFVYNCKRFRANENEMRKNSDAYFRYRDLLHDQQKICDEIIKMFGVLGVYSPDVSKELANSILSGVSPELSSLIHSNGSTPDDQITIDSAKVRDSLKLWEIMQIFLSAADNKATISDFRDFLVDLDLKDKATPQAIESALKTHPELFEEVMDNGQRFLILKQPAFWIRTWAAIMRSIRAIVRETKRKYAPDAEQIQVTEIPAHSVAIELDQIPGAIVQASISLTGTQIKVKTLEKRKAGKFSRDQIIQIEVTDSSDVYTHDGQRLSGPEEVAEIILAPILDCVRTA